MSRTESTNLVWIDLEMTGLDPGRHVIIEIATIVTDSHLNVVAEGPNLTLRRTAEELSRIEEWSARTHTASGLLDRVRESTVVPAEAERRTLGFLREWVEPGTSPLCGNSVHQDRRFLRREMPELEGFLHYRIIDVSTVKELVARWYPDLPAHTEKDEAHLAKDDVLESIAELKWYRAHAFAPAQAPG